GITKGRAMSCCSLGARTSAATGLFNAASGWAASCVITIRRRREWEAPRMSFLTLRGVPLLDEDYLILSTIHSTKCQEWTSVFVLNAVDGCIPSDLATGSTAEIEEERRLLYVAMTRARDHLHLVVPQRFYANQQRSSGDRHMYAARTRFIPAALLDRFESRAWPAAHAAAAAAAAPKREAVDIGARLRRMWS